jgi:hypothetical protein
MRVGRRGETPVASDHGLAKARAPGQLKDDQSEPPAANNDQNRGPDHTDKPNGSPDQRGANDKSEAQDDKSSNQDD